MNQTETIRMLGDGKKPTGRLPALDALRGVAVGLVMVRHAWPTLLPGLGVVGVAIFFTLSGYVITSVLANEYTRDTSVRYARFYRNRALRLWPALLALLVGYGIVEICSNALSDRADLPRILGAGAVYLSDLPIRGVYASGVGHLWSLAIEEQFYLVWPFVFVFASRRRIIGPTVSALAVVLVGISAFSVHAAGNNIAQLYPLPTSWAVTLLCGAVAYIYRERLSGLAGRAPVAVLCAIGLAASCWFNLKNDGLTYVFGAFAIGLASACIVLWLAQFTSIPRAAAPLHALGGISYAAYLWNYPLACWIEGPAPAHSRLGPGLLTVALTLIAAITSKYVIEKPVAEIRRRLDVRAAVDGGRSPFAAPALADSLPVGGSAVAQVPAREPAALAGLTVPLEPTSAFRPFGSVEVLDSAGVAEATSAAGGADSAAWMDNGGLIAATVVLPDSVNAVEASEDVNVSALHSVVIPNVGAPTTLVVDIPEADEVSSVVGADASGGGVVPTPAARLVATDADETPAAPTQLLPEASS